MQIHYSENVVYSEEHLISLADSLEALIHSIEQGMGPYAIKNVPEWIKVYHRSLAQAETALRGAAATKIDCLYKGKCKMYRED